VIVSSFSGAAGSADLYDDEADEQRRPREEEYAARPAIDPSQVTPVERTGEAAEAKAEGKPPHQRTGPYAEHQYSCVREGRLGSAEADRGKDAEESEDRNRVGQGKREGGDEIPGKAFGIRRRIQLNLGVALRLCPPTRRRMQPPIARNQSW